MHPHRKQREPRVGPGYKISKPTPTDTLLTSLSFEHFCNLLKQHHQVGTRCSNTQAHGELLSFNLQQRGNALVCNMPHWRGKEPMLCCSQSWILTPVYELAFWLLWQGISLQQHSRRRLYFRSWFQGAQCGIGWLHSLGKITWWEHVMYEVLISLRTGGEKGSGHDMFSSSCPQWATSFSETLVPTFCLLPCVWFCYELTKGLIYYVRTLRIQPLPATTPILETWGNNAIPVTIWEHVFSPCTRACPVREALC